MSVRSYLIIAAGVLSLTSVHAKRGAHLTEEQRQCVQAKVGAPDSGERPSREVMKAAFEECGVAAPKHRGPNGRPHLTEEQKACLKSLREASGQSFERPTKEARRAALEQCGVGKSENQTE